MTTQTMPPMAVIDPQTFPTGRRLQVCRQLLGMGPSARALCDLLVEAISHDQRTQPLERELDRQLLSTGELRPPSSDIEQVDYAMDKSLGRLQEVLTARAAETGEQAQAAAVLLDVLFSTAESITSLPYIDQLGAVDALLEELNGTLAQEVVQAGVQAQIKNIHALSDAYRQRLEALSPEELAAEQLCNARAQGQRFLKRVVEAIQALPDAAERERLLTPLRQQQVSIDLSMRSQGFVSDVEVG